MGNLFLRFSASILLLTLASCKTFSSVSPQLSASELSHKGIIVFSTSTDSLSMHEAISIVLWRQEDNGKPTVIEPFFVNNKFQTSQSSTEHRNVSWRSLPQGNYIISLGISNPYACIARAPEYHFSIKTGEELYLGDFHNSSRSLVVIDNSARDLSYFAKNSGLTDTSKFSTANLDISRLNLSECPP